MTIGGFAARELQVPWHGSISIRRISVPVFQSSENIVLLRRFLCHEIVKLGTIIPKTGRMSDPSTHSSHVYLEAEL